MYIYIYIYTVRVRACLYTSLYALKISYPTQLIADACGLQAKASAMTESSNWRRVWRNILHWRH